jgi:hypothetical protein
LESRSDTRASQTAQLREVEIFCPSKFKNSLAGTLVGQYKLLMRHQHCIGKMMAMKNNIVLADKMQLRMGILNLATSLLHGPATVVFSQCSLYSFGGTIYILLGHQTIHTSTLPSAPWQ